MNTITNFMDTYSTIDFLIKYFTSLLFCVIMIFGIYYTNSKNKEFVFTFLLFNTLIFIICFILCNSKLEVGFGFGIFAIFSLLRYRTILIPIKEMGYLFASITIGLISAISNNETVIPILISNALILLLVYVLDCKLKLKHENYKEIIYEKIELITSESKDLMLKDLIDRTGIPIHRIEIVNIDFLRDVAKINIFYYSDKNERSIFYENNKKD